MKTKRDIVDNWLPRYTGTPLADFGQHILLTNFGNYLEMFARAPAAPEIQGRSGRCRTPPPTASR